MTRKLLNYIVDLGMILSFVAVFFTGIGKFPLVLRFLARHGVYLPSNEITIVHEWGGIVMAAFILLHLVLHWKWIVSVTKQYMFKVGDK